MEDTQHGQRKEEGIAGEWGVGLPPPPPILTQASSSVIEGRGVEASETPRSRTASGGSIDVPSTPEVTGGAAGGGGPPQQPPPPQQQVKIQLRAVGSAPMLKKKGFKIDAREPFVAVKSHLRKLLQLDAHTPLFLYVNQAFSPGPDDKFGDLLQCFGTKDELIIFYGIVEAWG